MANQFAWASIGENGKVINGKAGDQTGREVLVGSYYDFGQDRVIRFKSVTKGRKCAKIARKLANIEAIGYDQSQRYTLWNLAKLSGWNYKELVKMLKRQDVECDCSSFASVCINLAYGKQVIPCSTTATIWENCKSTGKFTSLTPKKVGGKWHKGDMPVKAYNHIIINV